MRDGHVEIYDPVFKLVFYFVQTPSEKSFKKLVREKFKILLDVEEWEEGDSFGLITKQEGVIFLWLNSKRAKVDRMFTLMHETQHLAVTCLGSKGVQLDENTQEIFAHYHEYLFRTCYYYL